MQYLPIILTAALVHILAAMSPGPDFVLVTKNSLRYGRRTGVLNALGLGMGIMTHATYCLLGVAAIIASSAAAFAVVKYIGALYLLYIGISSLRAKTSEYRDVGDPAAHYLSTWQAIRTGFLANVTNPKVTLLLLSIFTIVIKSSTPLTVKFIIAIEMVSATVCWYSLVAFITSHNSIKHRLEHAQHYIERGMGIILILLSLVVATEHGK